MQGTRITFAKEGNQGPNHIPADIVFVVKYKEHPRFKREASLPNAILPNIVIIMLMQGDDLVHTVTVPLADALSGCLIGIQTLGLPVLRQLLHLLCKIQSQLSDLDDILLRNLNVLR